MVNAFTFYSNDPSSNNAEVYSFYPVNCLKRMRINGKDVGDGPLKNILFCFLSRR